MDQDGLMADFKHGRFYVRPRNDDDDDLAEKLVDKVLAMVDENRTRRGLPPLRGLPSTW